LDGSDHNLDGSDDNNAAFYSGDLGNYHWQLCCSGSNWAGRRRSYSNADYVDREHHRKTRVNRGVYLNSNSSPSGLRHGRCVSDIGVGKKISRTGLTDQAEINFLYTMWG
jgi:hypothetical protein